MELDLDRVARELGWAILRQMAAERRADVLERLVGAMEAERGDEPGEDREGDGNQGP